MAEPKNASPSSEPEFEIVFAKLQAPEARATIVAVQSMTVAAAASAEVARFAYDQFPPPFTTFSSS